MHFSISQWTALVATTLSCANWVNAHTIIVYPGYRGNNLHTNGSVEAAGGLGAAFVNDTTMYPYGMQWMYPCESSIAIQLYTEMLTFLLHQAVECQSPPTAQNGLSKAAPSPFNQAGSKATQQPSSTSISVSVPYHQT